jgi:hypothetical protein
MLKLF